MCSASHQRPSHNFSRRSTSDTNLWSEKSYPKRKCTADCARGRKRVSDVPAEGPGHPNGNLEKAMDMASISANVNILPSTLLGFYEELLVFGQCNAHGTPGLIELLNECMCTGVCTHTHTHTNTHTYTPTHLEIQHILGCDLCVVSMGVRTHPMMSQDPSHAESNGCWPKITA